LEQTAEQWCQHVYANVDSESNHRFHMFESKDKG